MRIIEIIGSIYLLLTVALWLWGLSIRFRWDGLRLHVFLYHVAATLLGIDLYGNVLTAGNFDETISTRLGIAARHGLWWGMIGDHFLGDLQANHCQLARVHDRGRAEDEETYLDGEKS